LELLGLALAIPAVVVANVCYVLLVRFGFHRFPKLRRWLLWPSYLVLGGAIIEIALVAAIGALRARTLIGPTFLAVHLVVFLLGAPSLANALVLSRHGFWAKRWYLAVVMCCAFGLFLVFFQVSVGEALDGVL